MQAVTTGHAQPSPVTGRRRAGLRGTVRSEFTKIRSVRSSYWALALLVVASCAWSIAFCAGTADHWAHMSAQQRSGFDPTQSSVLGLALLGQLFIVVIGALAITSEYSTQEIRTSLTVMPRRGVLYGAKAGVLAAVTIVVAFLASFLCFFIGQELLRSTHASATLSQPNVLRAVVAAALYVTLCGLFAFGLGAVLRSTAGTITAAYGIMFLLPELARALPTAWYQDALRWLPGGQFPAEVTNSQRQNIGPYLFSAWGELAVLGGYAAVLLVAGAVMLRRRDA
jgi:ABC-2 type transport system permease protein